MHSIFYRFILRLYRLLVIATWLMLGLFVLSQLIGRKVWQLELFSHYAPHLGVLCLLTLSISLILRQYQARWQKTGLVIWFMVGSGLLIWSVLPLSVYHQKQLAWLHAKQPNSLVIAYQNVNMANVQPKATLDALLAHNPDILVLVETDGQSWRNELAPLSQRFATLCAHDGAGAFAIRIYSPADTQCQVQMFADVAAIQVALADGRMIYALHPPPPLGQELADRRAQYLAAVKKNLLNDTTLANAPLLVVGDLNLSAFSPLYRDFVAGTRLQRHTANGLPTWRPFGISIDQVLSQPAAIINSPANHSAKVFPIGWQGSDHRGLMIKWRQ